MNKSRIINRSMDFLGVRLIYYVYMYIDPTLTSIYLYPIVEYTYFILSSKNLSN